MRDRDRGRAGVAVAAAIAAVAVLAGGGWYVWRLTQEQARLEGLLRPFEEAAAKVFPDERDAAAALEKLRARVAELGPADAAPGGSPRGIGEEQLQTMREVLAGESGAERKVWFDVAPANAEAAAVAETLRRTFVQAGWQASVRVARVNLKPGLFFMIADEQAPDYVATALRAFEQAGIPVTSASGYRAYYEEMKGKNPAWSGIQLAPDQAYTVVVGPKPTS
ncbi:MAG TPA: hypothetical protein VKZ18_15830 [Polyangia bacterium]|nr:hypothetical protein [Polyangia bacterium]